jgi:hypothetical protein
LVGLITALAGFLLAAFSSRKATWVVGTDLPVVTLVAGAAFLGPALYFSGNFRAFRIVFLIMSGVTTTGFRS